MADILDTNYLEGFPSIEDDNFIPRVEALVNSISDEQLYEYAEYLYTRVLEFKDTTNCDSIYMIIDFIIDKFNKAAESQNSNEIRKAIFTCIVQFNLAIYRYNYFNALFNDWMVVPEDSKEAVFESMKTAPVAHLIAWIFNQDTDYLSNFKRQGVLVELLANNPNHLDLFKVLIQHSTERKYYNSLITLTNTYIRLTRFINLDIKRADLLIEDDDLMIGFLKELLIAMEQSEGKLSIDADPIEEMLDLYKGEKEDLISQIIGIIFELKTDFSYYIGLKLFTRYFYTDKTQNWPYLKERLLAYIAQSETEIGTLAERIMSFFMYLDDEIEDLINSISEINPELAKIINEESLDEESEDDDSDEDYGNENEDEE